MASSKSLNWAKLTIESTTNKTIGIRELITEKSLDILALTETWLGYKDSRLVRLLSYCQILVYFIIPPQKHEAEELDHCFQKKKKKKITHAKMTRSQGYTRFEYLEINFSLTNKLYKFIVLYRPPLKTYSNDIVNEFYNLMSFLFDENRKVYICGNFNIWTEEDLII